MTLTERIRGEGLWLRGPSPSASGLFRNLSGFRRLNPLPSALDRKCRHGQGSDLWTDYSIFQSGLVARLTVILRESALEFSRTCESCMQWLRKYETCFTTVLLG